jgi:hypothetical protein
VGCGRPFDAVLFCWWCARGASVYPDLGFRV